MSGQLIFDPSKPRLYVKFTRSRRPKKSKKSKSSGIVTVDVARQQVSADLLADLDAHTAGQPWRRPVDFDRTDDGGVVRVRPPEGQFLAPDQDQATPPEPDVTGLQVPAPPPADPQPSATSSRSTSSSGDRGFANPYGFVRIPDRPDHGHLADGPPPSHGRYAPDRYTGRLTVDLQVVTPLIVPDQGTGKPDQHRTFGTRTDREGRPLLPPTAVKGMLRAAYEAVTNSRMPFFDHTDPLAFRMAIREAQHQVPVRVSDDGQQLQLMTGTSSLPRGDDQPLWAAWLPHHPGGHLQEGPTQPLMLHDGGTHRLPRHGEQIRARLRCYRRRRGGQSFHVWGVVAIAPLGQPLPSGDDHPHFSSHPKTTYTPQDEVREVTGYVCVTSPAGPNASNKRFERVFFSQGRAATIPLSAELRASWRSVIAGYEQAAPDRHLPHGACEGAHMQDRVDLEPGALVYGYAPKGTILSLAPVAISRQVYPTPPDRFLPADHHPAEDLDRLSPAERVFGWTHPRGSQQHHSAYRGNLRISPPTVTSPKPHLKKFDPPLQLAVLNSPKPIYARFYLGSDPDGRPPEADLSKRQIGYPKTTSGWRLRGRKIYPHQQHDPDHWVPPSDGPPADYEHVTREAKDFNQSISSWIKPGTTFRFCLHVTNLSAVELGALLYLLDLPTGCHHRLGGGKPLGFGSVRLQLVRDQARLETGTQRRQRLLDFQTGLPPTCPDSLVADCVDAFRQAVEQAYDQSFKDVCFIADWLQASQGIADLPVHYPRRSPTRDPEDPSYAWFQANEKNKRLPLPRLGGDLPYFSHGSS